MKKLIYCICHVFFCFHAHSTYLPEEQEISHYQLSSNQRNQLEEKMQLERVEVLGQTFTSDDLMIDLMPYHDAWTRTFLKNNGDIETRSEIPEGFSYTFQQHGTAIVPMISSNHRPRRLDGKYAKESSDGTFTVGTFRFNDGPVGDLLSLSDELTINRNNSRRQRLPEKLRDKRSTSRKRVPNKPTPEDLFQIEENKREQRKNQLRTAQDEFNQIPLDLIEEEEINNKIKMIKMGLDILSGKLDDESAFSAFFDNVQGKLVDIKPYVDQVRSTLYVRSTPSENIEMFVNTVTTEPSQREIKELALQKILAQEEKRRSRLERPNANPIRNNDFEESEEEIETNTTVFTPAYIFPTIPNHETHAIIQLLEHTSFADSSYSDIKITRKRLARFVEFLENKERTICQANGEILEQPDDLGYYYREDQGKGSHTKVKFGKGTKPVILSKKKRKIWLTIRQLQDIKEALIQKGLITLEE